jgi:8-oxo-dGTP pyrophosphatase MutT (NUDIX family)
VNVNAVHALKRMLRPFSDTGASAAVALLLRSPQESEDLHDLEILFVKRVDHHLDPWSGQMALPGGKQEATDNSLRDTIFRETDEEVNIDLHDCQFLGVLEPYISAPRPDMLILPFVFLCDPETRVVVNTRELERFIWIPLHHLQENRGIASFQFGKFPAFIVDENIIWGLTYRIVTRFISITDGIS